MSDPKQVLAYMTAGFGGVNILGQSISLKDIEHFENNYRNATNSSTVPYERLAYEAGIQFHDLVFECRWQGRHPRNCSAHDFSHVFTIYGNCYTFNHQSMNGTLEQIKPGTQLGLSVLLNIQQSEYTGRRP